MIGSDSMMEDWTAEESAEQPGRGELRAEFPSVHKAARISIALQRTFRIPDDGSEYPLPPGLGTFPMAAVDDLRGDVPAQWREEGGFVMPMYQSEALWMCFSPSGEEAFGVPYPFTVKVVSGRINALTGEDDTNGLVAKPQNYCAVPEQPWLDGFCVEKGIIRQFVAMPLGEGYTVDEQLKGDAGHGGLAFEITPLKREKYLALVAEHAAKGDRPPRMFEHFSCEAAPMGMGAGGRMRQEIYEDPFTPDDYDTEATIRLPLHICNSMAWRTATGAEPPHPPWTAEDYARKGLPWFEWYSEKPAIQGGAKLQGIKSVAELADAKGAKWLSADKGVKAAPVVALGPDAPLSAAPKASGS